MEVEVEVIRSAKRKKTVSACWDKNRIIVRIPGRLSPAGEKKTVDEMVQRLISIKKRKERNSDVKLAERARFLNEKYFGGRLKISSIRFVTNQNSRFGSCSVNTGDIRISHHLENSPPFVIDYVIIHELAHLIHPNHSAEFRKLVNRYPLAERATGYLIALSRHDRLKRD